MATPPPGLIRVATGVDTFTSPGQARAYLQARIAEYEAQSSSNRLERFSVPGIDAAIGLRRHVTDGDLSEIDTRVVFVRGDVLALAFVHDEKDSDHRAEVIAMAMALDVRIRAILGVEGA